LVPGTVASGRAHCHIPSHCDQPTIPVGLVSDALASGTECCVLAPVCRASGALHLWMLRSHVGDFHCCPDGLQRLLGFCGIRVVPLTFIIQALRDGHPAEPVLDCTARDIACATLGHSWSRGQRWHSWPTTSRQSRCHGGRIRSCSAASWVRWAHSPSCDSCTSGEGSRVSVPKPVPARPCPSQ